MSDTPRTDFEKALAACVECCAKLHELERENAALRIVQAQDKENYQCAMKASMGLEEQLKRENAALREALKPLLRHRPDGDIGWRDNIKAKCGWILVSDILRIEAALEDKEAQP